MRRQLTASFVLVVLTAVTAAAGEQVRLSKEKFLDKCKGAWAGQMIGVCYGAPTEFRSNGKPLLDPLPPWTPELVKGAIGQDDCYVEMTWLAALEKYGLDISFEQAGKAFADSQYPLWHANKFGRDNVRRGIMPPKSGSPEFNRHADDIDFQIEADLLGIICPGLPQECNRLSDLFGHVMNYGDGVYGGMFVGGMYVAAYLEDKDVEKVVRSGLACIPEKSTYHQCISDVLKWHKENPTDWLATWKKIEAKWDDDVDCMPGNAFNIDAKLNGAYIVMGLLYGNGDMEKTMEISTRCGQDSDCNPSSAAGVLACMKGYAALGEKFTGGIAAIENTNFSHTNYSFKTLIPACQRMVEKIIERAGGKIEADAYLIPQQSPKPAKLEQWNPAEKKKVLASAITARDMERWGSGWGLLACGFDMDPGLRDEELGRKNVLVIHPVSQTEPAVIEYRLGPGFKQLVLDVASDPKGDFLLKITVAGQTVLEKAIDTKGRWITVTADLPAKAWGKNGKRKSVHIENHANGWSNEAAYLGKAEFKK